MKKQTSVNLGNLLLSLSETMDLANPYINMHQFRTAYLAYNIADHANLAPDMIEDIFVAGLLHDIGAISVEEKLAIHSFETTDNTLHCIRGELLLNQIPWLSNISKIVRYHHQPWSEWEVDIDNRVALSAQIVLLADYVERLMDRSKYILHQVEDIIEKVKRLEHTVVHSKILSIFLDIAKKEELWLDLFSPKLSWILLNQGPFRNIQIEANDILLLSNLYKDIIDFKSSYTATHTTGVSECATRMAEIFGFAKVDVRDMRIAGNFHDVGKLIIPNSILEKEGSLTSEEFAIIKSHTYYTYYTLNSIGGLDRITEWAAYHHEKLDGSGYPFHYTDEEIRTGSRIMTIADIFTGISEDRPYRKGMSKNQIYYILKTQADNNKLDKNLVNLLFDHYDEISTHVKREQEISKSFYENRFLKIYNEYEEVHRTGI